ncbi:hypothetical protein G6F57_010620 [Rhizopus arrhizus]|uniref:Methyltransferase domain-containing protein n=1 Tax=Rhizopus oryzae TaxID=64495 RepID=A0A9P7BMM0_RHIOR|nr:hypothetical protein G6F23_008541 [Rhizopus arrhizus]KAG0757062.1 hypothetical protein G6F24_010735 [Rhizopus arrhizus]KAG0791836.1 hypothetical protein G6F22_006031 [Rhizopus arrhizus]KAG0806391.1 hypothetical protein G6F20_011158 [Rhizopus arrhizus]KAG0822872.1 hypothetical protein G6F19_011129 [Rhizopus arrhizus]
MPSVSIYKEQEPSMTYRFASLIKRPLISKEDIKVYGEKDNIQQILFGLQPANLKLDPHLSKKASAKSISGHLLSPTKTIDTIKTRKGSEGSLGFCSKSESGISMSRSSSSTVKETCILPKDESEIDRMVSQHYILRTAFDGDFSAPLLSYTKKVKRVTVLDMGCGSGTWTMEMAVQFPNVHFIGIDHSTLYPQHIKPKNCRFLTLDRNDASLPFEDASVDYIFQRDANWELKDDAWEPLIQEYFRILKPGGWIELVEADIETQSSPTEEGFLIDKSTAGFRSIQSDFQSVPLGWGYSKSSVHNKSQVICSEYARAAAMQHLQLFKSLKPWYKNKQRYDACMSKILKEWHQAKSYVNWHRSTAQKPY